MKRWLYVMVLTMVLPACQREGLVYGSLPARVSVMPGFSEFEVIFVVVPEVERYLIVGNEGTNTSTSSPDSSVTLDITDLNNAPTCFDVVADINDPTPTGDIACAAMVGFQNPVLEGTYTIIVADADFPQNAMPPITSRLVSAPLTLRTGPDFQAVLTLTGAADHQHFGSSLAANDLNADGVPDLVIGAEGASAAMEDPCTPGTSAPDNVAGSVNVYMSPPRYEPRRDAWIQAGDLPTVFTTAGAPVPFGTGVATVDFDGDGFWDTVINDDQGALELTLGTDPFPNIDIPVFTGGLAAGPTLLNVHPSGQANEEFLLVGNDIRSGVPGSNEGRVVALRLNGATLAQKFSFNQDNAERVDDYTPLAAGDLDGDGDADIIVAGPTVQKLWVLENVSDDEYQATGVRIYADIDPLGTDFGASLTTLSLGSGLAQNEEYTDDIIAGEPSYDAGRGRVVVLEAGQFPTNPIVEEFDIAAVDLYGALTDANNSRFGFEVEHANVRGGYQDELIVSAPGDETNPQGNHVWVIGATDNQEIDLASAVSIDGESREQFGYRVLNAGDLNMDGSDDLVIGAPCTATDHRGRVVIQYGAPTRGVQLYPFNPLFRVRPGDEVRLTDFHVRYWVGNQADYFYCTVEWGDGWIDDDTCRDNFFDNEAQHVYKEPGVYVVTVDVFHDAGAVSNPQSSAKLTVCVGEDFFEFCPQPNP